MVQERKHQDGENANLELSSVLSIFLYSLSHTLLKSTAVMKQSGGGHEWWEGRSMGGPRLLS